MHHELLASLGEHSPCSSIHPITPAHILGLTGGTLKTYRQDLTLPLVFCAQVGSEATDPFLLGANATSVLQVRPAAVYFSAWLVLPGCGAYEPHVLYGWLWVVRDRVCFYCRQFPTSHVVN
jgi:hypothetical protein